MLVYALPGAASTRSPALRRTSTTARSAMPARRTSSSSSATGRRTTATTAATPARRRPHTERSGGSTAAIALSPNGSQSNIGDEWARYVANTDVEATRAGDAEHRHLHDRRQPRHAPSGGPDHTALLKSMAKPGQGQYFAVSSGNGGAEIAAALNEIFKEVLAVNSVFAASALPASVNARGTFLNQVYMGMFRPDAQAKPRWPGNLKQYKLGEVERQRAAGRQQQPGTRDRKPDHGFHQRQRAAASGPRTAPSGTRRPTRTFRAQAAPPTHPTAPLVEKGGAAFRLRTVHATDVTTRKLYTCTGACTAARRSAARPSTPRTRT